MVNMTNVMIALNMMWKGMLGIFVVIVLVMLIVMLLTKITQPKSASEQNQDQK